MPEIPTGEFLSGDLVFRRGRTMESDAIAGVGGSRYDYSHVGVIVSQGDSLCVVHVEPMREGDERVKMVSLQEFFHPANAVKGCVTRCVVLGEQQRQIIEREAMTIVRRGVEFDHDYRLSDTTAMYCTELIDFLFRKVDISLTQQRYRVPLAQEDVLLPSSIMRDGTLKEVWSYDLRPARHN
ncbi:MAG: hypothetical protein J6P90_04450 [Rikenellaceae bacterium]|nr:hypothetical protein [Rikenellaceae bacterium]